MYFNDEEFKKYLAMAAIVAAFLGWGLVEALVYVFSHITVSFG